MSSMSRRRLTAALTLAAVIGKQFAGFGVLTRGVDRVMVGLGMIPRGEVELGARRRRHGSPGGLGELLLRPGPTREGLAPRWGRSR